MILEKEKSKLVLILLIIFVLIFGFMLKRFGSFGDLSVFVVSWFLFTFPGILLFAKSSKGRFIEQVIWGSIFGMVFNSFLVLIVAALTAWNLKIILLTLIAISFLAYVFRRKMNEPAIQFRHSERWQFFDYKVLLLFLIITLLAVYFPFHNAGKLTDRGYAYTALFSHDFILRMADVASLSHSVPPDNMFFAGQKIHNYYWLWYAFPAFVYNFSARHVFTRNIMILTSIFDCLLFVGALFCIIKLFVTRKVVILLTMGLSLVFYSYYDFYVLLKNLITRFPTEYGEKIGSLGIFQSHAMSQCWLRDFLFEPHTIFAMLIVMLSLAFYYGVNFWQKKYFNSLILGALLAFSIAADVSIGLMWIVSYGCYQFYLVLRDSKDLKGFLKSNLLVFFGFVVVNFCFFITKIYSISKYSNSIIFKPYYMVIASLPIFLLLEFGPKLVFSVLGVVNSIKKKFFSDELFFLFLTAVISIIFMCFITETLEGNVILRKGIKLLQLPLVIFSGIFFQNFYVKKKIGRILVLLVIALAIPTLFTDIRFGSNIKDEKHTTYVNVSDYQACQWIKTHIPVNSTVQSEFQYPGYFSYAPIINFGERKMAFGYWKMAYQRYPNLEAISNRLKDIRMLFKTRDVKTAKFLMEKYKIDYIYIGPVERRTYEEGSAKFGRFKNLFRKVYSNHGVDIYEYLREDPKQG